MAVFSFSVERLYLRRRHISGARPHLANRLDHTAVGVAVDVHATERRGEFDVGRMLLTHLGARMRARKCMDVFGVIRAGVLRETAQTLDPEPV